MAFTTQALHRKTSTGKLVDRAAFCRDNPYLGAYVLGGEISLHDALPAVDIYQLGLVPLAGRIVRMVLTLHNWGSNSGTTMVVQKNGNTIFNVPTQVPFSLRFAFPDPRAAADSSLLFPTQPDVTVALGDKLTLSVSGMDANARGLACWVFIHPYSAAEPSLSLTD